MAVTGLVWFGLARTLLVVAVVAVACLTCCRAASVGATGASQQIFDTVQNNSYSMAATLGFNSVFLVLQRVINFIYYCITAIPISMYGNCNTIKRHVRRQLDACSSELVALLLL